MGKRRKFEKLEYNEAYFAARGEKNPDADTEGKKKSSDESEKKHSLLPAKVSAALGMDSSKVPEKINPSTRFTYSKTRKPEEKKKKEAVEIKAPPTMPFVLMIGVLLLVFASGFLVSSESFANLSEGKAALLKTVINAAVYLVPVLIYVISSPKRKKAYYVKGFSASMLPFMLSMLLFTICFTALQKYYLAYNYSYSVEFGTASKNVFLVLLTGAVLPAVFEELFVHGVFQFEISKYAGGLCSVTLSALVFAALQFDFTYFLVYFFIGVVMGSITHVTRSVFSAMIVRFISSAVSIFLSDRIAFIAVERIGGTLLMIILATFCFVFLIVALRIAENVSDKRSVEALKKNREEKESAEELREASEESHDDKKHEKKPDETEDIFFVAKDGNTLARFGKVLLSPYVLAACAVFIIGILTKQS